MRDIKFQAFDTQEGKMWPYEFSITNEGRMFWVNSDGELKSMWETIVYTPYYPPRGRFILRQYTGLKDKNGKEIYGGDILLYRGRHIDHGNYQVKWEHQAFVLRKGDTYFGLGELFMPDAEVIGNIYEVNDDKEKEDEGTRRD